MKAGAVVAEIAKTNAEAGVLYEALGDGREKRKAAF